MITREDIIQILRQRKERLEKWLNKKPGKNF